MDAHGQENPEAMLPLFESYLDKKVGKKLPLQPAGPSPACPRRAEADRMAGHKAG